MHQILSLPILFPILAGAVMLILRPTSRRLRNLLLMASVLLTTAFALTGILLSYRLGGDALSCGSDDVRGDVQDFSRVCVGAGRFIGAVLRIHDCAGGYVCAVDCRDLGFAGADNSKLCFYYVSQIV